MPQKFWPIRWAGSKVMTIYIWDGQTDRHTDTQTHRQTDRQTKNFGIWHFFIKETPPEIKIQDLLFSGVF